MSAVLQVKPKFPSVINILLVIVLGVLASKLLWLIVTPESKLNIKAKDSGVVISAVKKEINYGKIISKQHLFGEIKKVKVTKAPPKKEIKKAVAVAPKLNLKLHGLVAYKNNKSFALISSNNGPQKVYGEGEEVQKNVTVSKIFPDRVVLSNHGKDEDLRLPIKNDATKGRATIPNRPPQNQRRISRARKSLFPAADQLDLGGFRQEVMTNPGKMMDIARPSPAIVNGKFIGFRVQPGTKRKLFKQLGFRPNDIITEVNGIVLDAAEKGAMVLAELAQASSISIKVKRGTQELFIEQSF